jgi:pimeloyl-ACP methyl ester carboxylesterase
VGEDETMMEQRERTICVDGIWTHVSEAGSGAPLVLVHGLGGPLIWQRVIDPLAQSFRVIVIDLPGFGESDCPPAPFSTWMYAEFLAHTLDELKVKRAMLVGISYGGQIALNFACSSPECVEQLVIVNATGLKHPWNFLVMQPMWTIVRILTKQIILPSERWSCWFVRWSYSDITKRPDDYCQMFHRQVMQPRRRDAWLDAFRYVLTADLARRGSAPDVPTLIVWGDEDRLVPVRCAEELHRFIANSQLAIVQSCGHSLPLEKPNELCDAIVSFYQTERSQNRER